MRVVLDTNVLVSAAILRRGNPFKLLDKVSQGKLILITSLEILEELESTLAKPRMGLNKNDIKSFSEKVSIMSGILDPRIKVDAIKEDPDDNKFLECAIEGRADYIVSGDHHLLDLKEYKGIRIITPKEMLGILRTKEHEFTA